MSIGQNKQIFPLKKYSGPIPEGDHPGAFGAVRKHDVHTGVDLYCEDGDDVYAIEEGEVIAIEKFTGEWAGSPWWNNTSAVLIEGESGIILYGEVYPGRHIYLHKKVYCGEYIGSVQTVLKKNKGQPMSMLHMELYSKSESDISSVTWNLNEPKPDRLEDITQLLIEAIKK